MVEFALEGPKWTTPVVTWSLAAAGGVFTDSIAPVYQALVQQAAAEWDDVAGITLQQVADSASADIRIGFGEFGAGAGEIGETDYSYYSGTPETFAPGVTVRVEDPVEHGLATVAGTAIYTGTQTSMYQVILHEVGHALGLNHSTDVNAVMYPSAGAANRDLDASDIAGIQSLYGAPDFAMTDTTTGAASHPDGTAYSGPVGYLQRQIILTSADGVAVAANAPSVFIHTGSGDDAISVSSGQNVLDGGEGSNFLTGGSGNDTFYVDGRGGQVSWGTLVNFHPGDTATLWGFTAGASALAWADGDGTAGYTGRTIHADLTGGGGVTTSITFAGLTAADTARFAVTTGSVGGNSYLAITNPA